MNSKIVQKMEQVLTERSSITSIQMTNSNQLYTLFFTHLSGRSGIDEDQFEKAGHPWWTISLYVLNSSSMLQFQNFEQQPDRTVGVWDVWNIVRTHSFVSANYYDVVYRHI